MWRPSNFYLSDFAQVHESLYIGDAGGAFHAGPAGFTLVINCASKEVPNYYAECRTTRVEYASLPLPGGPSGISALAQVDLVCACVAVSEHILRNGKILVHCVEGRHHSAGIVFALLQTCYNFSERAAFHAVFRVVPHMDFHNVPQKLFGPCFEAIFAPLLANISFGNSTEYLRIRYGNMVFFLSRH
jgi:hypothetical protein